jgi:chemotaxis protein methyltransferase CheR
MDPREIEDIEIYLLLEALRLRHGYDFRQYAPASLRRRIIQCLNRCEYTCVSEIIPNLLYDDLQLTRLISELSINVTEMFRDPGIFAVLRQKIFPMLAANLPVNIWHAGCSTGEEVYSLAILLHEADLLPRCRIYATDINPQAIEVARLGSYPLGRMRQYSANYLKAGGTGSLSDHYQVAQEVAQLDPHLRNNILFTTHNLATDSVFSETHLILCRNVLIYFDSQLRDRVLRLFLDSLRTGGILCLGSSEGLRGSALQEQFQFMVESYNLYAKN